MVAFDVYVVPREAPNADSRLVRVELTDDEDDMVRRVKNWEMTAQVLGGHVDGDYFIVRWERRDG